LNLDLHLELDPGRPRGAALEAALREAIRDGRLRPGDRLPASRTLAADLGLARGTVVEAFAQLEAEGYLEARHGSGTRVTAVTAPSRSADRAAEAAPAAPRFSFHPGLPDLSAFPRAAWTSALRRGLRDTRASTLGYGDPRGRAELRAELATYLARVRGVVADPEAVMVCAGFRHGLSLLARVLHRRGARRIAVEDPCVIAHRAVAVAAGLRVVPLAVDAHGARTDLLNESGAAGALLAPAHQFPLGVPLHRERRAAAVAWAREADGLLIEDDYDAELRYDRQPLGALQALDPEHVAYGGTVSKTLVPGLRLGWLVLPPSLLGPALELRRLEDVHVSALEQVAFAELLRSGAYERHIRRMRTRYRRRRDRLVAVLAQRAPGFVPTGISAGLRVLLQVPLAGPSGAELATRAAERSIELFPIGQFRHGSRPVRDGVVVGYGSLPDHDFEAGLAALGDLLAEFVPASTSRSAM
jgi:GntR family transcriptional regulator/MocR family aminotransferase